MKVRPTVRLWAPCTATVSTNVAKLETATDKPTCYSDMLQHHISGNALECDDAKVPVQVGREVGKSSAAAAVRGCPQHQTNKVAVGDVVQKQEPASAT